MREKRETIIGTFTRNFNFANQYQAFLKWHFENLRFGKLHKFGRKMFLASLATIVSVFQIHGLPGFGKETLVRNAAGSKLCS